MDVPKHEDIAGDDGETTDYRKKVTVTFYHKYLDDFAPEKRTDMK